jgi:hypothetical protein
VAAQTQRLTDTLAPEIERAGVVRRVKVGQNQNLHGVCATADKAKLKVSKLKAQGKLKAPMAWRRGLALLKSGDKARALPTLRVGGSRGSRANFKLSAWFAPPLRPLGAFHAPHGCLDFEFGAFLEL